MAIESARNPHVDGLRGLGVLALIVGHTVTYRFASYFEVSPFHSLLEAGSIGLIAENVVFKLAYPLGLIGVKFLLVIAGYGATRLLVERETRSHAGTAAFYIRRCFRIIPAMSIYILAIVLMRGYGLVKVGDDALVRATLCVCNLSGPKCFWWLAHTWPLDVELQFCLALPVVCGLFGGQRTAALLLLFVAFTVGSFVYPTLGGFPHILGGALLASSERVRAAALGLADSRMLPVAGAVVILHHVLPQHFALFHLVEPAALALLFFATICGRGPLTWLSSWRPIQTLGLASYSIYLWQQLATAPLAWNGIDTGAAALHLENPRLALLWPLVAAASYLLIERPMNAVGHEWAARLAIGDANDRPGSSVALKGPPPSPPAE